MLLIHTEIKFLAAESEKLPYIHELLLTVHGEAALIMNTFWWWEDWLKKLKQEEQYLVTNHGVAALAQPYNSQWFDELICGKEKKLFIFNC